MPCVFEFAGDDGDDDDDEDGTVDEEVYNHIPKDEEMPVDSILSC